MNRLAGTVSALRRHEGLSLVSTDVGGHTVTMVGLEPPRGLAVGSTVILGIKATHLILAAELPESLTLCNALPAEITAIREGEILACVDLSFGGVALEAILPRPALIPVLKTGRRCYVLFQASEVSILEVDA